MTYTPQQYPWTGYIILSIAKKNKEVRKWHLARNVFDIPNFPDGHFIAFIHALFINNENEWREFKSEFDAFTDATTPHEALDVAHRYWCDYQSAK